MPREERQAGDDGSWPETKERTENASGSDAADIRSAEAAGDIKAEAQNEPVAVPFDRVQAACQTFTAEWEKGGPVDLPSYLAIVAEDDQGTLLRNLLEYEIHKRRESGESPRADEYLEKLPKHTAIVRQVFLDTSQLSLSGEQGTGGTTTEFHAGHLPASRLGEFRLVKEIGRGGMGAVFEAVHIRRGHRVALKTLPAVTPEALHRFKREFRLAAELVHPNLVGLHSLENDGGQYFITMELVEGVDFASWIRSNGAMDLDRLRQALTQLVGAVIALHAQGVVHRDLKPQNVLVTREGRVVVLDFGLVSELAAATASLGKIAGTPAYMAPEQAAGKAFGPPADWYALGVMLYEALAGRPPFTHADVWQLLREKQERDAPALQAGLDAPEDLKALCMKLLARDPASRPGPSEIAGGLQSPVAQVASRAEGSDQLIGREAQLAEIQAVGAAIGGTKEPIAVFVSGRSGEGKTSLAERFLATGIPEASVALAGRCYDRESVPYKALDTVIGALADYLRSLPGEKAALLLPDDIGMLAQMFPELNRCEAIAAAPKGRMDAIDQQQIRSRAFGALRLLVDRIGASSPVVMFIDDLQWGDEDSARAIFEVLRPPYGPRVLFLGTFRSDESEGSPFLCEWNRLQEVNDCHLGSQEIQVGPLPLAQATELIIRQLRLDNETVRRRAAQFHAQTAGNPFLLTELAACFDPESDSFQTLDMHGVLEQKLSRLHPESRALLNVISVSGQALDIEEAIAAVEFSGNCDDTLFAMRNSRLLRLVGNKLDTYHDRIRYATVDRLEDSNRIELHSRLAQVIESRYGGFDEAQLRSLASTGEVQNAQTLPRIFDLSFHWDAAGDSLRALGYGLAAAARASRQFAQEVAAEQYALAEKHTSEASPQVRFQIARGKARALYLTGRFTKAQGELDKARALAEQEYDIAEITGLKGDVNRSFGMIDAGIDQSESAMSRLGLRVPRSRFGLTVGIVKETAIQTIHTLFPSRLHRRSATKEEDLCTHLLGQAEYCYYMNSIPKLLWASMVGLNRAERVKKSSALSLQYIVHANDMAVLGWHSRARKYYRAAFELSQSLNDQRLAGVAVSHNSIGKLAAADYEAGVAKATEAQELLYKLGDFEWEGAQLWLSMNLYHLGKLSEAAAAAHKSLHSSVREEHHFLSALNLLYLVKSSLGRVPFEELVGSVSVPDGNIVAQTAVLVGESHWHAHHGRFEEAYLGCKKAWAACKEHYCLNTFNMSVPCSLVTSIRHYAESLESRSQNAKALRQEWYRTAGWANRLSWLLPPQQPHALRELGLAYAHRGRTKKALALLSKSCDVAEQQKARFEHALSSIALGQLSNRVGRKDGDRMIRAAESQLQEIEGAVDQFLKEN